MHSPRYEYHKAWRAANPARVQTYRQGWAKDNPRRSATISRRHALKKKYGLTEEEFGALLAAQDNRCALCQTTVWGTKGGTPAVDHSHSGGTVRGLLCVHCNLALGHFHDDVALIRRAADYVERDGLTHSRQPDSTTTSHKEEPKMAQITSGVVRYEGAVKKPGDGDPQYWLSKKAAVELSFSVDAGEGHETIFDVATQAAMNRVASMLGTAPVALVQATGAAAPAEVPKRGRGRPKSGDAVHGSTSADPAAIDDDPTAGQEAVIHLPDETIQDDPAAIGGDDPAAVEEWEAPVEEVTPEITDADLNSEVQKKNGELADPARIRALIGEYNPDKTKPFQLRQLPQAERAGFLAKLRALKKAA